MSAAEDAGRRIAATRFYDVDGAWVGSEYARIVCTKTRDYGNGDWDNLNDVPDLTDDATWGILVGACRRRLGETFSVSWSARWQCWGWLLGEDDGDGDYATRFDALAAAFEHIDTLEAK